MNKKKKVGLFGGSFDPIHFGHLNLAIGIKESRELDEVWFCPTQKNPLKTNQEIASFDHRVDMLELAIEDIPFFKVNEIEKHVSAPSYTIDMIKALKVEYNDENEFFLILGEDALTTFDQWKNPNEILDTIPIYIGSRNLESCSAKNKNSKLLQGITKTALFDISSTQVRNRLKNGEYCGHLIPAKVLDYIFRHQLYS